MANTEIRPSITRRFGVFTKKVVTIYRRTETTIAAIYKNVTHAKESNSIASDKATKSINSAGKSDILRSRTGNPIKTGTVDQRLKRIARGNRKGITSEPLFRDPKTGDIISNEAAARLRRKQKKEESSKVEAKNILKGGEIRMVEQKLVDKREGKPLSKKMKLGIAGLLAAAFVGAAALGINKAANNGTGLDASEVHIMEPGETFDVGSHSIVVGDVVINGERYFDDLPSTGLIVEFQKRAKVTAPWGATVKEGINDQALMNRIVEQLMSETLQKNPGIKEVTVVIFPGENSQG